MFLMTRFGNVVPMNVPAVRVWYVLAFGCLLQLQLQSTALPYRLPPLVRSQMSIAHMQHFPAKCESWFRFKAGQLGRLFSVLRIPLTVKLENGSVYPGEQIMLLALRRLVFPARLDDMTGSEGDQSGGFGRGYSQTSRAF